MAHRLGSRLFDVNELGDCFLRGNEEDCWSWNANILREDCELSGALVR
jgi:hypothetical protein